MRADPGLSGDQTTGEASKTPCPCPVRRTEIEFTNGSVPSVGQFFLDCSESKTRGQNQASSGNLRLRFWRQSSFVALAQVLTTPNVQQRYERRSLVCLDGFFSVCWLER